MSSLLPVANVIAACALAGAASLGAQAVRDPAYARDGRLAASVDGDLWVRGAGGDSTWRQLTHGAAWDGQPAWSADGRTLVFASDRAGQFDLWRVAVDGGEPERLTTDPAWEGEPTVAPDGRIAFVRGREGDARIRLREADGREAPLSATVAAERWPAFAPDGSALAYVRDGALRVRTLRDGREATVVGDRTVERPAWAPDGTRLAVAVSAGAGGRGVQVVARDGRWSALASTRFAQATWAPDGRTLALASIADARSGYNGDPDRLHDMARERGARPAATPQPLLVVAAPLPPDAGLQVAPLPVPDRARRNGDLFDAAWVRTAALYFAEPGARRTAWERLRDAWRPRALAAANDSALARVLHAMHRARPPLRAPATGRAAVSSAHPLATAAGLELLAKGGNVVDAAVAVSFALGVVEPDASGIGGYGQLLVKRARDEAPVLIDFMSRAPEAASIGNPALAPNGRYPDDGPALANVPGTVAGMHRAFVRFGSGRVTWADALAPAIRLAREGYPVSDGLATTLRVEQGRFRRYPASVALFFRDGRPLAAGDTVRNPDLAATLERIARDGPDGFYRGETARRMVEDLRAGGNVMTLLDVQRYHAVERAPVRGTYRGHVVFSSAPPVSGGATLVAQLGLRELGPPPGPWRDDAASMHALLSAWLLVPGTRGRIADPALWPVDVTPFTHPDTLRARWRCFDATRAPASPGDALACAAPRDSQPARDSARAPNAARPNGTTAFAVADAEGNVVAVTQTLGTWGGTFHVTPGLGFLYNDKLTSYPLDAGAYGARLPNARHGSTLAPTIVLRDGRPVLAVGAAGNAWITSAVLAGVIGAVDDRLDAQGVLELPRLLPGGRQGDRVTIDAEDDLSPDLVARLRTLGWDVRLVSLPGELRMGYGAAITWSRGRVTAGADPRRSGAAGAVP